MDTPYTYLIGWRQHNTWYYGVRYARGCHPDDLWTKYFTSSKYVQQMREEHGDPDVIKVRRTFTIADEAREWEHKVLRRLDVVKSEKWLNKGTGKSIPPQYGKKHSDAFKDRQRQRMLLNNPMVGRIQSEEEKAVRIEIRKRPRSTKAKENIRQGKLESKNPNFGKTWKNNDEYCQRMSERLLGRIFSDQHRENLKGPKKKKECVYCKQLFAPHILARYHNEKCKERKFDL